MIYDNPSICSDKKVCRELWKEKKYVQMAWATKDIINRTKIFLSSIFSFNNTDITNNLLMVYLRKGMYYHFKSGCLQVARISVKHTEHQRQGHGTNLINQLVSINPYKYTVIECVQNPYLKRWLENNGWKALSEFSKTPTFYKINDKHTEIYETLYRETDFNSSISCFHDMVV